MVNIVTRAARFANEAHKGQVRKYTGEPYINHPARVALSMSTHWYATDELVAAAWLHDVAEDCGVTEEQLFSEFGLYVTQTVLSLTNPPKDEKLPRAERKRLDREHLLGASQGARIIKLYDRLDNLRDLAACPDNFPLKYASESLKLLEVIGPADRSIEQLILKEIETLTSVKKIEQDYKTVQAVAKADWELEKKIRSIVGLPND